VQFPLAEKMGTNDAIELVEFVVRQKSYISGMDESLTEQDLYDLGISFNETLGMYKLSKVLCYDLSNHTLYCQGGVSAPRIPISTEIKSRQDLLDLYALLFNK
jgi:hypothetical protein